MNTYNKCDVFLDANMIIFISNFKKYDVADWLNCLYDKIYIHIEVFNELILPSAQKLCATQIERENWVLFDPGDSNVLNDSQFEIYQSFFSEVRRDFTTFQSSRTGKHTTDQGDVAILAGCRTLSVGVISSQDNDLKK